MGEVKLTSEQQSLLAMLALRPHGAPVRGERDKAVALELCGLGLVCDPHLLDAALFTRITPAGRRALSDGADR